MEDLVDQDLLPEDTDFNFIDIDEEGIYYYQNGEMLFSVNPEDHSVTFKIEYDLYDLLDINAYFTEVADDFVYFENTKRYSVTTYAVGNKLWDVFDWHDGENKSIIINCSFNDL